MGVNLKKSGATVESMFHLLLLVAAQASASPVVVPGGQYLLPGGPHQNLLRRVGLPYHPVYPFTNWRLITQDVVIDIDVDYTCVKEGVFINEEDCGSYFVCNDNGAGLKATKVNCPGATADGENVLAFNDVTGSCDWAVNVPGCGGERQIPQPEPILVDPFFDYDCTEEVDGRIAGPTPCIQPIIACEDGSFRIDCDPVSETWWWTAEEDPEDFDCSGKVMGVYEHPDQCNMYYVCTS